MTTCQHCTRRTTLPLCTPCVQNLAALLAELPWLLHQLDITVCRQDHLHTGGTNHNHTSNPVNIGAMETMRQTSATLHRIALDVAQIHASERIPALVNASPAQVALWLKNNLNAIQRHNRAGEHYKALTEIIGDTKPGRIHEIINRPDLHFTGPCPTLRSHNRNGEPIHCNHTLWAHDGETFITCPRCGNNIDVQTNQRRAATRGDLLPEQPLLEALNNYGAPTTQATLTGWISTNQLKVGAYLTRKGRAPRKERRSDPECYSFNAALELHARNLPAQIGDDLHILQS